MGIADDLLALAAHMADPPEGVPQQASLRRSVSTTYYALFHLLIQDAALRWSGTPALRGRLERAFEHGVMKQASEGIERDSALHSEGSTEIRKLQAVAVAFVQLQQERHSADYDNTKLWADSDALSLVNHARVAFDNWRAIRHTPAAQEFLLSLLIGKKRR